MLKALGKLVVALVFVAVLVGIVIAIIDVMIPSSPSVIFISDYNFVIEGATTRQVEAEAVTGEILTYNLDNSSICYDAGDIQYVVETRSFLFHFPRSVELHLQRK